MSNIVALIENYPELKSNHHVNQLLASLNETEEQKKIQQLFIQGDRAFHYTC